MGGCDLILHDIIQEKDTGNLFVTFSHGVGMVGYKTKAFTLMTGFGTVDYSSQSSRSTQIIVWLIAFRQQKEGNANEVLSASIVDDSAVCKELGNSKTVPTNVPSSQDAGRETATSHYQAISSASEGRDFFINLLYY